MHVCFCYSPKVKHSFRRIMVILYRAKNVVHTFSYNSRSAITTLKVNRFWWNLEHYEHIVGGWPWLKNVSKMTYFLLGGFVGWDVKPYLRGSGGLWWFPVQCGLLALGVTLLLWLCWASGKFLNFHDIWNMFNVLDAAHYVIFAEFRKLNKCMSVHLIVNPKCMLAASHAAFCWVTLFMPTGRTNARPLHYAFR